MFVVQAFSNYAAIFSTHEIIEEITCAEEKLVCSSVSVHDMHATYMCISRAGSVFVLINTVV